MVYSCWATPASVKVAIRDKVFTAASAREMPKAAPVPSPRRIPRLRSGVSPRYSSTIRCPGSLHGVIKLQPGDNAKTIVVLVFGTYTWTIPSDTIGNFELTNMPEGSYHVRFLTTLDDYDPLDINLIIKAGIDDTLSDTLDMPFHGIPIPTGLTSSYDTLMQNVTLTWNKADTSLVKGYNVYRKNSDSDFVKINRIPGRFHREFFPIRQPPVSYTHNSNSPEYHSR